MTMTTQRLPILELHNISKRFGAVQALSAVDFEVYPGEVVGLVGDNGAGKSTLVKVISGVYRPDQGEYFFDGRSVTINNPREASALGIETVYQDLSLCDNLDVVANLFLGREQMRRGLVSTLNEVEMEQAASHVIQELSVGFRRCARALQRSQAANASRSRWPGRSSPIQRPSCWMSRRLPWVSSRHARSRS